MWRNTCIYLSCKTCLSYQAIYIPKVSVPVADMHLALLALFLQWVIYMGRYASPTKFLTSIKIPRAQINQPRGCLKGIVFANFTVRKNYTVWREFGFFSYFCANFWRQYMCSWYVFTLFASLQHCNHIILKNKYCNHIVHSDNNNDNWSLLLLRSPTPLPAMNVCNITHVSIYQLHQHCHLICLANPQLYFATIHSVSTHCLLHSPMSKFCRGFQQMVWDMCRPWYHPQQRNGSH